MQCTEWLTLFILGVFFCFPIVILAVGQHMDGSALGPAGLPPSVTFFALITSVLWNLSGWAQVGYRRVVRKLTLAMYRAKLECVGWGAGLLS